MAQRKRTPRRRPATPAEYKSKVSRIDLATAWLDMKPGEFALWVRLCAETPKSLAMTSKTQLSDALGYSRRRLQELLVGLEHLGYVRLVGTTRTRETRVQVTRRAVVHLWTGFIQTIAP